MKLIKITAVMLIMVIMSSLAACGKTDINNSPQSNQETAPKTPEAVADKSLKGTDSAEALLDVVLQYLHNGRDYSIIEDVHDVQASLAYFLFLEPNSEFYEDGAFTFDQAMEKVEPIMQGAEALEKMDPELAEMIMEDMQAVDPEEYLRDYLTGLKNAVQSGAISKDNPAYETISSLLSDWEKGLGYIMEHYPEILENAGQGEYPLAVGLEGAVSQLMKFTRYEIYANDLDAFSTLECEYSPEKVTIDENGICSLDMGHFADGGSSYSIDMIYYVKDEIYYLIGFETAVGGTGG